MASSYIFNKVAATTTGNANGTTLTQASAANTSVPVSPNSLVRVCVSAPVYARFASDASAAGANVGATPLPGDVYIAAGYPETFDIDSYTTHIVFLATTGGVVSVTPLCRS